MNIWIIDDDLVSQFATQYRIEQSKGSYCVRTYDKASDALKEIIAQLATNGELPDILLLDLVMPVMSGWEFLDELEKIYPVKKNIKVYVLSAFNNYKDRDLAKEHPLVHGFFDKPLSEINADKIIEAIKS